MTNRAEALWHAVARIDTETGLFLTGMGVVAFVLLMLARAP